MSSAGPLFLLHGDIAALAAASVCGFAAVRKESRGLLMAARLLGLLGALAAVALLLRRSTDIDGFPLVSRFDTYLTAAVLSVMAAVALDVLKTLPILTISALPLAFASLVMAAAVGFPSAVPATDSLVRRPLSGLHVTLVMLSFAAFEISFVASVLFLIEHRQLKSRSEPSILGLMPSLETTARLTRRALLLGVVLLTAGAVLGYQQGRQSLSASPAWRTDPVILVTTAAWVAYLVVGILSFRPSMKGRRTAVLSAAFFLALMVASWAAAFWSGFHRDF